jgi:hypothetical protein
MHYIVQENTFREENYDTLITNLERLELSYDIVKSLPYTDLIVKGDTPSNVEISPECEWVYKNDRTDCFIFGSIKLARTGKNQGWNPGSLINSNHDYDVYKNHWKDNLLNWDSKVIKFTDDIEWNTPTKFIRPCEDTKVFTGSVYTKEEWDEFVHYSLNNGHSTVLCEDTRIQVSTNKDIYKEIRFWVVGGKVISGSQYRIGNRTIRDKNVEPDAYDYAQKMVDLFQLADCFVIDICLTPNGWKIVEAGCINSAGFYLADMNKVLIALEEFYGDSVRDKERYNSVIDY